MYTSLVLFALTAPAADSLSWMRDYREACKVCAEKSRPMAVFLGEGKTGYDKVVEGGLTGEIRSQLSANYLPVYIDTTTEAGKTLAEQFEMPGGQGIVISNRDGSLQAFRHAGELTKTQLTTRLQRYAEGNRVVSTTDTLTSGRTSFYSGPGGDISGRTSYYGPSLPSTFRGVYPAFQGYPAWGGGGRGGCPSCR